MLLNESGIVLSVVIPVYNAARYLEKCLTSILSNESSDFEVVLVDDGSTDNSFEICQRYHLADKRIKLIHKANGGVSSARNYGIDISLGKYIVFADADDFYEDDAIDYLLTFLNVNNTDGVIFSYNNIMVDGTSVLREIKFSSKKLAVEEIKKNYWLLLNEGMWNSPCNKVYSKEIIEKYDVRFVENLIISEDGIFNIDYFSNIEYVDIIAHPIYNYVMHKCQSSKRRIQGYFSMMEFCFNRIANFLGEEYLCKQKDAYYNEWLFVLQRTLFHQYYHLDIKDQLLNSPITKKMLNSIKGKTLNNNVCIYALSRKKMWLFVFWTSINDGARKLKRWFEEILSGKQ